MRRVREIRKFNKDNGNVNKNVTPKYNLAHSQVFREYSVLFTWYNRELKHARFWDADGYCYWMGTNSSKAQLENEWFIYYILRMM